MLPRAMLPRAMLPRAMLPGYMAPWEVSRAVYGTLAPYLVGRPPGTTLARRAHSSPGQQLLRSAGRVQLSTSDGLLKYRVDLVRKQTLAMTDMTRSWHVLTGRPRVDPTLVPGP